MDWNGLEEIVLDMAGSAGKRYSVTSSNRM
jgi:hypothetical protein